MTRERIKGWTVRELMKNSIQRLEHNGIGEARLSVELLLARALACERIYLYLHSDRTISEDQLSSFEAMLERRLKREPVQYIVGTAGFMGLNLKVDQRVLIPRPETETLVEQIMLVARNLNVRGSIQILEVGTGSGNVAIALAKFIRGALLTTVDASSDALELARENAALQHVSDRLTFVQADVFGPALVNLGKRFHIIASNPPYVSREDFPELEPDVLQYEPYRALYGGIDGKDYIRRLAEAAPNLLLDGGYILVEIGYGQAGDASRLLRANHFQNVECAADLEGVPRVVVGYWEGLSGRRSSLP